MAKTGWFLGSRRNSVMACWHSQPPGQWVTYLENSEGRHSRLTDKGRLIGNGEEGELSDYVYGQKRPLLILGL